MTRVVSFTPARVDVGVSEYTVVGTQGELARLDPDGKSIQSEVQPFPAAIPCSTQIDGGWLGIWVEPDHRLARMALLNNDIDWQDGKSRSDMRLSQSKNLHPAGAEWSRSMEAEPSAICSTDSGFCFALRSRGIYHLDPQCNEIWRAKLPSVLDGRRRGLESAIALHPSMNCLMVWYDNGLLVELSMKDGSEIDRRSLNISERIEAVFHSEKSHFIALAGGGFSILNQEGILESHATPGPVSSARFVEGSWEFTGWRHDGRLSDELVLKQRQEIGVGFVGQRILTNDGTLADFEITRS